MNRHLIFIAIVIISCGHTTKIKRDNPYSRYVDRINYLGRHRTGVVALHNNEWFKAEKIRVSNDSLICFIPETQIRRYCNLDKVKSISFKDRFISSVYGCLIGCVIGLGLAGGSTEPFPVQNVLIVGGLAGAIPGYLIGSNLNFIFVDSSGSVEIFSSSDYQ